MNEHMQALEQFPLNRKVNSFRWHKNPILERGKKGEWDDDIIRDPMIFFDNNASIEERFKLYYCGKNKKEDFFNIGLAYGSNLENLKKYSDNPIVRMTEQWEQGALNHTPYVIQIPGTQKYEMIYTAYNKNPSDYLCSLVRVLSTDGKAWTDKKQVFKKVKVGNHIYHPQKPILHYKTEESTYYLIFSGSLMQNCDQKNEGFTALATSMDGEEYNFEKIIIPQDLSCSIYDCHGFVPLFGWYFLLATHDSAWAFDCDGYDGYPERWLVSKDMRNWVGSPLSIFDTYPDDGILYSHLSPLLTEGCFAYFVYDYGEPNRFGLVKLPLSGKPYTLILDKKEIAPGVETEIAESYPAVSIENKQNFSLTVEAEYHKSCSTPLAIHLFSSYDGTHWDTEELKDSSGMPLFGNLPLVPGDNARMTKDIATNARYIKVTAENRDKKQSVRNVKIVATI